MNKETKYISYIEAVDIYHKMIEASDGGYEGIRDDGGIRSTLDFIMDDMYYPSFCDKLSHLVFQFCRGHYFNDGNKRIALTLGAYFLHKNDYHWQACIFMRQMESIVYHIAASNIDKDLLYRILECFMNNEDYDEELKIDIANAMNNRAMGISGEDD
ncbi:MAG: Fic family protein [Prevotella sp.]|nr:Fic family protein [Prevotella sp.]